MCVLSTWFGDICCSRRDFCNLYVLQKVTITLFQILLVAAAYEQTNVISRAVNRNALAIDRRPSARRRRTVPCDLGRASLPVPPLFSIMFLDTLYSKKWYDMPHIGCDIHSLQRSTISCIGRHSAGYN